MQVLALSSGPFVLWGVAYSAPASNLQHIRRNGGSSSKLSRTRNTAFYSRRTGLSSVEYRLLPCVRRDEPSCSTGLVVVHASRKTV
jgi:hypothetical protein